MEQDIPQFSIIFRLMTEQENVKLWEFEKLRKHKFCEIYETCKQCNFPKECNKTF